MSRASDAAIRHALDNARVPRFDDEIAAAESALDALVAELQQAKRDLAEISDMLANARWTESERLLGIAQVCARRNLEAKA